MDVANNNGNRICFRLIMCVLNYHYTSLMLNSGLLIANRIEDFVIGTAYSQSDSKNFVIVIMGTAYSQSDAKKFVIVMMETAPSQSDSKTVLL